MRFSSETTANRFYRLFVFCFLLGRLAAAAEAVYPAPYIADAHTLHLYHFDGVLTDAVQTNPLQLAAFNGAAIVQDAAPGFGSALRTFDGVNSGTSPYAATGEYPTLQPISAFIGPDGAFTFEALIRPELPLGSLPNHMQIICADSGIPQAARAWHFRINTSGRLQFTKLTGTMEDFTASIPVSGAHAYKPGAWYHIAVTFNGLQGTPDNLKLYWTRLDANAVQVQQLGSFSMTQNLAAGVSVLFSIGNELRAPGFSENFEGLIDEVRISSIARAPSDMLYTVDPDALHYYRFDGSGADAIQSNPLNLVLQNGANISQPSLSGFGTALDTFDGIAGAGPYAAAAANPVAVGNFTGSDGAFTFEALIQSQIGIQNFLNHMQIVSGDNNSSNNETRGWHFRINTAGNLQFTKLTGTLEEFEVPLPIAGDHAYAPGTWYHTAVTYNGADNTPGNLKLYWTRMNSDAAEPLLLASLTMTADLNPDVLTNFAVGNRLRTPFNENFEGLIDEVRISRIARSPAGLLYKPDRNAPRLSTQPEDLLIDAGYTAAFQAAFTSATTPHAVWFKTALPQDIPVLDTHPDAAAQITFDEAAELYTATLTLGDCRVSDGGEYYVRIGNLSGNAVFSRRASLGVEGLLARWTLDLEDFTGTQYLDTTGGWHAAVDTTPTFTTGADGTPDGAVLITPAGGWASVAGFDPAYGTGRFTVSYWINWQAPGGTSDFLMTSDTGAQIAVRNGLSVNQKWQHVCAVFDGADCTFYLDGIATAVSRWPLARHNACDFFIGRAGPDAQAVTARLDDLRIYNYALDAAAMAQIRYDFAQLDSCILPYGSHCDWTGPDGLPDCRVDLYDLADFASFYLNLGDDRDVSGTLADPDGIVNFYGFIALSSTWLDCGLYPNCP